jgi:hypothetical protein
MELARKFVRSAGGHWLAGLLLAAIVFRALIPPGFVPVIAGTGLGKLVICTSTGAKLVPADTEHGKVPADDGKHASCIFSALPVLGLVANGNFNLEPPPPPPAHVGSALTFQLPPSKVGPLLGVRGPPLRA